jgi:3,4-dihydroxy 2-butanone 4-phosphate synthase/GTP cyclohydrolase II
VAPSQPVLVRVHMQNTLCDLFSTSHPGCSWPLKNAMKQIAKAGSGIIVVLRNHDTSRDMIQRMREFQYHDKEQQNIPAGDSKRHLRTYGIGAQILCDLGVQKMRVLSAPKSLHAISGFDLEIVEYVACE